MMREGETRVPARSNRGANLIVLVDVHVAVLISHAQSAKIEDAADIQVQNLLTRPIWRGIERATPSGSRIAHKDI